jgi:L-alanine-DL-glutamate epimerase-like enolase superfamily enzyme
MSIEPYTEASEIIVEVFTDQGIVGVGEIHGRPMEQIAKIITEGFRDLVVGQDPMNHERIWNILFSCTHTRRLSRFSLSSGQPHFGGGGRPQMMASIAGIDIALWDIKGKALGQPVYRLLGGNTDTIPVYASGGYYREGADLRGQAEEMVGEMTSYVQKGYNAVKMKVGGMSVEEDAVRVKAVRDALPDVDIMLDANLAYDVPTAIRAARAFEPLRIRWYEEPVHWYDPVEGLGQVSAATTIPTASGESEHHRWGCRDLINRAGIRIMQFDCTRAGGVTEWLRVASYAAAHGVLMAPHHDPQIHGHLVAAVPNGHIVEAFPNPERDPLWEELFLDRPEVTNGQLRISEEPGFGIKINEKALKKYRLGRA